MKTPAEAQADWDAWMASRAPKSEHALQVAVVNWCRSLEGRQIVQERFYAIPNGAFLAGNPARRAAQASKLKAEGMRSGVPDLEFYGPGGRTLRIEMKNGKAGRLSDEQREVHASLIANGHQVEICRTLDETRQTITKFFQG